MSDEELLKCVRTRLQRHRSRQLAQCMAGTIFVGLIFPLCGWAMYLTLQGFQQLGAFFEIQLIWGGAILGILISAIGSMIGNKAGYDMFYTRRDKGVRLLNSLLWYYECGRKSSAPRNNISRTNKFEKYGNIRRLLTLQKSTTSLFGIPLRQSCLNDRAFIQQLTYSISQKEKLPLAGVILSVVFLVGTMIYNFFIPLWGNPFILGMQWGILHFLSLEIGGLLIINALRGTEFQRIEELVIKYYDMSKEKERV